MAYNTVVQIQFC